MIHSLFDRGVRCSGKLLQDGWCGNDRRPIPPVPRKMLNLNDSNVFKSRKLVYQGWVICSFEVREVLPPLLLMRNDRVTRIIIIIIISSSSSIIIISSSSIIIIIIITMIRIILFFLVPLFILKEFAARTATCKAVWPAFVHLPSINDPNDKTSRVLPVLSLGQIFLIWLSCPWWFIGCRQEPSAGYHCIPLISWGYSVLQQRVKEWSEEYW